MLSTALSHAALLASVAELTKALEAAAEFIKDRDAGDPQEETGWKSDEALAAWIAARAVLNKFTPKGGAS